MPHVYRSCSAKEPYNHWLFCERRPATSGIVCIFAPLQGGLGRNVLLGDVMCCSALLCVVLYCSVMLCVLLCVVLCCSVTIYVVLWCSLLLCVVLCCSVLASKDHTRTCTHTHIHTHTHTRARVHTHTHVVMCSICCVACLITNMGWLRLVEPIKL